MTFLPGDWKRGIMWVSFPFLALVTFLFFPAVVRWGEGYKGRGLVRWEGRAGRVEARSETREVGDLHSFRKILERELQPGDILLGRCELSPVPSLSPWNNWTHAALYAGRGEVVVASNPLDDVERGTLAGWLPPHMTWAVFLRVEDADENVRKRAVQWALEKVGKPYAINWLSKGVEKDGWYCSEFVWAAYMAASEGEINLEKDRDFLGVSPNEIFSSPRVVQIGGVFQRKPDTMQSLFMKVLLLSLLLGGLGTVLSRGPG